ncbi:kinase-like domain-containing protein [Cantharellus anzutake]|uniref:kinase-like domain-containing protein n=1 Tax=Cantharellus anzutake TaxID=1750568 RepID=UPI001904F4DB|nr:kinase-like domain-containing protein [Cantharellus anzutake]KAF8337106.1 kinase-like domain-containing protein [Cantharellus anzutake]
MMREVKVWTALQHSNVVTFHGWAVECSTETDETCAKLVSTWCEGGNVTEYLKHTPNADRRRLVLDAAQGLQYLHAKNVIHGDVKPENIVVNGKGIAMLCDFGLSCILLDLSTYADGSSTAGTARYTAPEVLNGEVQYRDGKSDVWALGCTSGQILFDLKPYHELETYPAILRAIMAGHAPFEWNNPDDFLTNINRCLKQNPSERPTIEELVLHFNYD